MVYSLLPLQHRKSSVLTHPSKKSRRFRSRQAEGPLPNVLTAFALHTSSFLETRHLSENRQCKVMTYDSSLSVLKENKRCRCIKSTCHGHIRGLEITWKFAPAREYLSPKVTWQVT